MAHLDHRLNARRVAVIGAGWAGLAAAVTLIQRGTEVVVFEASRHVGGRARRVDIEGKALDNGQHILVGAYGETLRLMRAVGVDPAHTFVRMPLRLTMADGFELRTPRLPTPLDALYALVTARGLGIAQRMRALSFALRLHCMRFRLPHDEPLANLLRRHGQCGPLRDSLWGPLCVAALNTPIGEASAQAFLNVLRDTLNGGPGASDLLLPRTSLGALFPEPAAYYLAQHGGELRFARAVRHIAQTTDGITVDGERFDAVVIATAPQHAARLLPPECAATRTQIEALDYQPIYTCYLQYAADTRLRAPMLGFANGPIQWAFDRGALDGHAGLIAVVISARGNHEALSNDELAALASTALQPTLDRPAAPQWHRVIAEKRATYACRPNLDRPDNATPLPTLLLAGDYTRSDYPGTLETAVRSGVHAANLVQ